MTSGVAGLLGPPSAFKAACRRAAPRCRRHLALHIANDSSRQSLYLAGASLAAVGLLAGVAAWRRSTLEHNHRSGASSRDGSGHRASGHRSSSSSDSNFLTLGFAKLQQQQQRRQQLDGERPAGLGLGSLHLRLPGGWLLSRTSSMDEEWETIEAEHTAEALRALQLWDERFELRTQSLPQLRSLAQQYNIAGRSKMRKRELIAALEEHLGHSTPSRK